MRGSRRWWAVGTVVGVIALGAVAALWVMQRRAALLPPLGAERLQIYFFADGVMWYGQSAETIWAQLEQVDLATSKALLTERDVEWMRWDDQFLMPTAAWRTAHAADIGQGTVFLVLFDGERRFGGVVNHEFSSMWVNGPLLLLPQSAMDGSDGFFFAPTMARRGETPSPAGFLSDPDLATAVRDYLAAIGLMRNK